MERKGGIGQVWRERCRGGLNRFIKIGTENDGGSDKNETQDFGQEPSGTSIYPKEEAFFETCPLAIIGLKSIIKLTII